MSPAVPIRTLPWSGSLGGKSVTDLAAWIYAWEPYQASVAMAAINSCINSRALPLHSIPLECNPDFPNLAVFDYFLPHLRGKKVVVIGRYPGLERYREQLQLTVLEQQPTGDDLPAAASEFVFGDADWVFITASSIPNKTFPRLAELAAHAKTVLMGPTGPWLPQLHELGIDYLAGVEIIDSEQLTETIAQGGGVRIFNQGLRYRVAELSPLNTMAWLKQQIADCAAEKYRLTVAMNDWYAENNRQRFPDFELLEQLNVRLSRLDSSYKPLWDQHGQAPQHL